MKTNEQLMQILGLCLEINPTETNQEITGNKPTVFFRFSGHCSHVEVNIYPTGWSNTQNDDYTYQTYNMCDWVKRDITSQETSVTIGVVIADLERIKQEVQNHE